MTEPTNMTMDVSREQTAPDLPESATTAPVSDADASDVPQSDDDTTDAQERSGDRQQRRDERTRARLRETEQERDRYREALVPHVRAAVETAAASQLSDPAALWLLPDLDPFALLDDDMGVDRDKVAGAVALLHERLPSTAKRFAGSVDAGARTPPRSASGASWANVIRP